MNNKGIKKIKNYVIVVIILILAIIAMFLILESSKKATEPQMLTTTTTTTKKVEDKPTNDVATPFSESLGVITFGYEFKGNYKETIRYNNAIFDFNCNSYDEENNICTSGSGLMRYNYLVIPLYTYEGADNNYLNYPFDYYIDITDNYIFLSMNHVGVSSGNTMIYDINGNMVAVIKDTLTGYILNGKKVTNLYPNYQDDRLYLYYQDKGIVKIGYVNIEDPKRINQVEIVEGAKIN